MAAEFNEWGLRFLYPENWTLSREPNRDWPRSITVSSPSGAFWSITIDRAERDDLIQRVVDATSAEYEEVECQAIERTVGQRPLAGFELHFYCLDLLIVAQILGAERHKLAIAIMTQAESREFYELLPVFDAISWSLIREAE